MIEYKSIHTGDTPQKVAQLLTRRLLEVADTLKRPIHVALSGGATPNTLFEYWSKLPHELLRRKITFWWVDERILPLESSQSNAGNALRAFFQKCDYPQDLYHPIISNEGASPLQTATLYTDKIINTQEKEGRKTPLDVAILGIGEDGHTSSLFPGQPLQNLNALYIASKHPTNGVERVALSYHGILETPLLLFHVLGAEKKTILQKIFSATQEERDHYPAGYVMNRGNRSELYTDIIL